MDIVFENGVIKTPDLKFDENCGGIGNVFFNSMKKYHDRIALIKTSTDEYNTYSEILLKTISTAQELQRRGFKQGDLIAISSNKENLNANIPIIAGQFLGCITFSLDPALTVEECVELVGQVQPKIIFVIDKAKPLIEETFKACNLQTEIIVFEKEYEYSFLTIIEDRKNDFAPLFVSNLQDTCFIHFSSGSTGTPKPICLSHYYFLALITNAGTNHAMLTSSQEITFLNQPIGSVSLRYSNWYWCSVSFEMMSNISSGGCRLMQDHFRPSEMWNLVQKYHITELSLTPLQCVEISGCIRPQNCDTSSLIKITIGGYILHKDYVYALRNLFPGTYICQTYGMTECGITTSFNVHVPEYRRLLAQKPNSCGVPINGLYFKIVDVNTGKKCGPNEPGELYLKGKKMFNGFYNKNVSTSFDDEGYFRTGDLVKFDEDFCFYILDRIKAVLGWNDWLIYPSHIEKVLLSHPSVYNGIVIGIPHKIEGERLMGVVVLKEGAPKVTEEKLVKFVANRVEDHKRLREGVKFVKRFPTTITGKIDRLKVKKMVLHSFQAHKI